MEDQQPRPHNRCELTEPKMPLTDQKKHFSEIDVFLLLSEPRSLKIIASLFTKRKSEVSMKRVLLILPVLLIFLVSGASSQENEPLGKVFWRGVVDDKVHLVIKGTTLEQKAVSGQEKPPGTFSFTAPLPDQPVIVSVKRIEGRSKKITVIQQPNAENGFTAIVEIYDNSGGAKEYRLEIFWK